MHNSSSEDRHAGRTGVSHTRDHPGHPRVSNSHRSFRFSKWRKSCQRGYLYRVRSPFCRDETSARTSVLLTLIQMQIPGMPQTPKPDEAKQPNSGAEQDAAKGKMINDAVAYLRSLAQLRGRSEQWPDKFVRDAATLTSKEALKEGVIDFIATDVRDLLARLQGQASHYGLGRTCARRSGCPDQSHRTKLESKVPVSNNRPQRRVHSAAYRSLWDHLRVLEFRA